MFFKKHDILKEVEMYQIKNLKISQKNKSFFQIQIDGEFLIIKNRIIDILMLEKAINVIA